MKIVDGKKFSSLWTSDKKFLTANFFQLEVLSRKLCCCVGRRDTLKELAMEDRCERNSCVRGYHIYMSTWDAIIGEELPCKRETTNK